MIMALETREPLPENDKKAGFIQGVENEADLK